MSEAELQIIAETWHTLCAEIGMDNKDFEEAFKGYAKKNDLFPTPAKIIREHQQQTYNKNIKKQNAIPQTTTTPEEKHKQAVSAAMLLLALSNPKAKKFFSLPSWKEKKAMARHLLGNNYPFF